MANGAPDAPPPPEFEKLIEHLRDSRGVDFTGYKRASLQRRIDRRMQQIEVASYDEYVDVLQMRTDEFTHLFNTVLINVTSFFRDPDAWEEVRTQTIPRLVERRKPGEPLRIWSAGCASGEEPYTLAMLFAEELGIDETRERVKIYATDIDDEALATSRAAVYDLRSVSAVPDDLREKYFEPQSNDRFAIRKELRRSVIFGRNDLVQDAPISRIDLLACRNTLMYLNAETQSRVLDRFHFALDDAGFLFLGKAEMLLSHGELFAPLDLKRRIFTKVGQSPLRDGPAVDPYGRRGANAAGAMSDISLLMHEGVYSSPYAQVILDNELRVAFANARAQSMFSISPRDVGRPFQDLELSYRPAELRGLIDSAAAERRPLEIKDVEWTRGIGDTIVLDVSAVPLVGARGALIGTSLTLTDVTRYRRLQEEHELANRQLEMAYEELQSTNEELETTNEELQSTVEELETTNEELHSTNEELETMNEELHSTNDELQVINDELRERSRELAELDEFMDSVMGGLQVGVVVVDADLRVLVWNEQAYDLWGLRPGEAEGAYLLNLDIGLPVTDLRQRLRSVLAGDTSLAVAELSARTRRGREVVVRVTATPLQRAAGIAGCIIAMAPLEDGSLDGSVEPAS